ncbi:MAG: NAD(+)/NADH kinase [Chloroflexi bacterium]|nr:NAD(+)/NADH kinase [Chloroflexota bacterium]
MTTVGIIANPAAGKDIRRLVAQGRFVPNDEKVNIIKRLVVGLDASGVDKVIFMPDPDMLARRATQDMTTTLDISFLDMSIFYEEIDSTKAATLMREQGVGCLITLGGDGTNRAVAKGSGSIPLMPVSTGTNNVFPQLVEGTVAGLAAGIVARGLVDHADSLRPTRRLEIYVDGELRDIALVDVAVSKEWYVGARAIWDMSTVHGVFVTGLYPASIGLAAIGSRLPSFAANGTTGLYLELGDGGTTVTAPVAPGMISPIGVKSWRPLIVSDEIEVSYRPCTIALDGERSFTLSEDQQATVRLTENGPPVVNVEATLRLASVAGAFCIDG